MYSKLLPVDKFIEVNKLQEITDPIYLSGGRPSPKGLFSYEIFGITPEDRKEIWAYIDLGAKFLHPLAYINLKRYSRKMEGLISGVKKYKFVNGEFIEDENGETGIDFLYKNYDNISWKKSSAIFPNETIKFLQQGKDKLFITKYPVIPPFYRDISTGSNMAVHDINGMYKKLIQLSSILKKHSGSFLMFTLTTRANIQNTIEDIFRYCIFDEVTGKYGLLRSKVMGVNIDRGVRLVMSAPSITGHRYTDMKIDFNHAGVPLSAVITMGFEFMVKATKDFFDNEFMRHGRYTYYDEKTHRNIFLTFIHPEIEYSEEFIKKKLDQFVHGSSTRFETILLPKNKENIKGHMYITGRFGEATKNVSSHPATWTDVFYILATKIFANKHISVTRYPIEDYQAIADVAFRINTTIQTEYAKIGDDEYKFYPIVQPDKDSSNAFIDTLVPCNQFLEKWGGDFDGDMVSVIMLWSNEANADAEKFMKDKKNFLGLMGESIRTLGKDYVQSLYSLTKDAKGIQFVNLGCKI